MKKITSFVLAMLFVLTLLPTGLTASADSVTPTVTLGSAAKSGSTYYFTGASVTGSGIKTILVSFTDTVTSGDKIAVLPASTGSYSDFKVSDTSAGNDYTKRINISTAGGASFSLVQSYLQGIGFTIAGARQTVSVVVTTESVSYDTFFNIDTQHYYQYIPFAVAGDKQTWIDAYKAAMGMSFMGRSGYLATIATDKEDKFVNSLSGDKIGWLGGTRLLNTGASGTLYYSDFDTTKTAAADASPYWYWACGPERGDKFFDQVTATSASDYTSAKNSGFYFNWATNSSTHEPNNSKDNTYGYETCLTTLHLGADRPGCKGTAYSWNDIPYGKTASLADSDQSFRAVGYFVEYGNQRVGSGTPMASVDKYGTGSAVISDSYTATVTVNKPGSVELRTENFTYPLSGSSGNYTASVPAATYEVYIDGADTGKSITVTSGGGSVSVTYIAGAATITGDAICGQQLEASIPFWTPVGTLSYQWTRGGSDINGAKGATYTPTADDVGSVIAVRITDSGALGAVESAHSSAVVKAASTPATGIAPVLSSESTTVIILTPVSGYEYILVANKTDPSTGTTWQSDNKFTGCTANTVYDAYQRVKETDSTLASAISPVLTVKTCPAAVTDLTVKSADDSAVLNWTAAVDADGYYIYKSETSDSYDKTSATVVGGDKNTYTITGLDNGKTYYFTVKPYVASGISDASNEVSIAALGTPTGLTWSGTSAGWTAVNNATAYKIQLYKDGVSCGSAVTVNSPTTSCSFSDAIIGAGTGAYTFKVTAAASGTAYSTSAESSPSSEHGYSVAPDASSAKINYRAETVSYDSKYEVAADTSASVTIPSAGSISAYIANYGETAKKLYIRLKASGSIPTSGWTEITVKARPETPLVSGDTSVISYDYHDEQLVFAAAYEASTATSSGTAIVSDTTKITPSGTLYLRAKATDDTFSSDWATITVPSRPAKPDISIVATNVTDTGFTVNWVENAEYSKDGGLTWQSSNVFTDLAQNTDYSVKLRYAAVTSTKFASEPTASTTVRTKATTSAPSAPVIKSQTFNSITIDTVSGCQYAITADNATSVSSWGTKVDSNGTFAFSTLTGSSTELTAATQYKIWVRVAETDTAMPSAAVSCLGYTAKATPAVSVISYDYSKEQIIFASDYEVFTATSGGDNITSKSTQVTPSGTLYLRAKSSGDTPASDWVTITVPARPTNDLSVTVTKKTDTSITLAKVEGAEYSNDNGATWQTSNEFKGLSSNTEYPIVMRYAATNTAFASAPTATLRVTTKSSAAAPSAPVIVSQTEGSITINTNSSYEYSITAPGATDAAAWEAADGSDKTFSKLSGGTTALTAATQYKIWVRVAETNDAMFSDSASCLGYTAKATPASSVISYDYSKEQIIFGSDYEVFTATSGGYNITSASTKITPSGTLYLRAKSSGDTPASDWVTITVPARPANDLSVTVTKKTDTSIVLAKVEGAEYSKDNGVTWQTSNVFTGLTPNTEYSMAIRYAAIKDTAFASAPSTTLKVTTKSSSAMPSAPVIVSQTAGSITINTNSSYEYSITAPGAAEADAWETADGSDKTFSKLSGGTTALTAATQYKIWVRVAETDTAMFSDSASCLGYTAKATPASGEGYTVDYTAETITVSSGYEVSTDSSFGTKLHAGDVLTPGTTYYVREAASSAPEIPASANQTFTLPSRLSAPVAVAGTDETIYNKHDGTLSKVTEAMEYKLSTASDWTSVTASQASSGISGLAAGTYLVRYKAVTESGKQAFKSQEASVVIASGSKITVTFDYQGGSLVSPVTDKAYGDSIAAPTAPTKTGFYFGGWYTDKGYKTAWSFFSDKLTDNISLFAKWNAVPTYTVRGSAIDDVGGGHPVAGATVLLRQGNKQYGPTVLTDSYGNFEISNVEAGIYNLVVKKDDIEVIIMVEVINCDKAVGNVILPSGKASSALVVNGSDTPDVVVGGLNTEANKQHADDKSTSTVITLTVEEKEEKTADKGAEVTAAASKNGKLVAMLLQIDISKYTDNAKVDGFNETSDLIELIIPLETALQGKDNYCVYRSHKDSISHIESIDTITNTPNSDKEFLYLSTDGKSIILHVKKFSTYAIAYSAPVISSINYQIQATSGIGGSISPSSCSVLAGGSKTFTVAANSGYSISKVLVDGVNVGSVASYTFSNIYASHTIEAVFTSGTSTSPFKDVTNADWFYDAVSYIANAGLMKGTDAGTFSPDLSTTRGMIITIIYRLEGEPAVDSGYTFKDVASGDYYDKAVAWGAKNGIIKGFDADTYGPNKLITREQLAAIFDRYAAYKGYDVSNSDNLSSFADASHVSDWALVNVRWAVAEGLMTGTGNNMLSAGADSTRAQAATMFKRFIEKHK